MKQSTPSDRPANAADKGDGSLTVWGEQRRDPDWDRYLAALIALALRRIEEDEPGEAEEARG